MPFFRISRSGATGAAAAGPVEPESRPPLTWSTLRPASWPNSVLAAALIGLLVGSWAATFPEHISTHQVVGGLLTLLPFLLVPWRPRIPELLLGTAIVCEVAAAILGLTGAADIVGIVAVYTIAAERTLRATSVAIVVVVAGEIAAGLIHSDVDIVGQAVGWAMVAVISVSLGVVGRYMARRRAFVQTLVFRTEHLERERDQLERERELLAREAVAVERARMARELHDVVAHHVSVMVIQAGAAQATLPPDAGAASQSLEAIRQTGREALAEMRRMLGLLRSDAAGIQSGEPSGSAGVDGDLAPQPGLANVEALAERMRETGLIVDLEPGQARRLPPGIDLSAYRVVQEALTNVLRHAGSGAHVRICLDYEPDALVVEAVDDGRGRRSGQTERAPNEVGHGLVGMRERVSLFGGTLEAGPRPEGGFRIRARFPIETIVSDSDAPFVAGIVAESERR